MSEVEYIESDRMGRLILENQFLYKMKSKPCEKQHYYCVDNCGSSVHLLLGKITSLKEKHQHPNHEARIANLKFRNNLRKRVAEDPLESVNKILEKKITSTISACEIFEIENIVQFGIVLL